jgi:hypothetical protein
VQRGLDFLVNQSMSAFNQAGVPQGGGFSPQPIDAFTPSSPMPFLPSPDVPQRFQGPGGLEPGIDVGAFGPMGGGKDGGGVPQFAGGGGFGVPQGGGSLVPELSPDTLTGMGLLRNQFVDNPGAEVLGQTVGGGFLNANPFTGTNDLSGVRDSITRAATQAVGDRFSQAGRSGSPAEAFSLAGTIARELAPFEFGARESAMGRGFQGFEAERGRQNQAIPAALGLPGLEAQNFLTSGAILEDQQRLQALEPFERVGLFADIFGTALQGAPRSSASTGRSRNAGLGFSLA